MSTYIKHHHITSNMLVYFKQRRHQPVCLSVRLSHS